MHKEKHTVKNHMYIIKDKEAVVQIYNGILFSHKMEAFESVLMRCMDLEPIYRVSKSEREI